MGEFKTFKSFNRCSAAVLANSGREPFGFVGLETMAPGGVACRETEDWLQAQAALAGERNKLLAGAAVKKV